MAHMCKDVLFCKVIQVSEQYFDVFWSMNDTLTFCRGMLEIAPSILHSHKLVKDMVLFLFKFYEHITFWRAYKS